MRVLVADDDDVSLEMVAGLLEQFGYDVATARDGLEAWNLVRTGQFRLVISDWEMPEMSGLELCRQIRQRQAGGYVYVIILTARAGTNNIVEGLSSGADDFLTKPVHPQELAVRLRTGERILALESRDVIIFALARLAESRDRETGAHLERIREYSKILAEHLAAQEGFTEQIDGEYVEMIYLTSPLHDIGKVGVPDSILLKPGKLTENEFRVMQQHTVIGGETLDAVARLHPEGGFLSMARDIAWSHHEKFDGTGYPRRLRGSGIPLCGRIVALADVYDALTTRRVYKPPFPHDKARQIVIDGAGVHFDPHMVQAFLANEDRFVEIQKKYESGGIGPPPFEVLPAEAAVPV